MTFQYFLFLEIMKNFFGSNQIILVIKKIMSIKRKVFKE